MIERVAREFLKCGLLEIMVLEEDQGRSGAAAESRPGFARLVGAVGRTEVGIVMSLEVSRLSRNDVDWHHLVHLCRSTATLIADEHGVHDPTSTADRMVLGIRGQVSELERDSSVHRMVEARWAKARRGEVFTAVPAGYDVDDRLDPAVGVPREPGPVVLGAVVAEVVEEEERVVVGRVPEAERPAQADVEGVREFLTDVSTEVASAGGPEFSWSGDDPGGLKVPGSDGLTVVFERQNECLQGGFIACARWWFSDDGTITRGQLVFDSPQTMLDTRIGKYIFGAALGLHTVHRGWLVMRNRWQDRTYTFTEVERQAIHMMYQHRAPGNRPPDREAGLGGSTSGGGMGEVREAGW